MIDRYIDWLMLVPSGDALPIANERWTNAGAQFGPSAGTFPQSRARAPSGHLQRHGHSQLFITWPIRQDVRPRCYHVNVFFSYYSSFFSLLIILSWFLFFFCFFFSEKVRTNDSRQFRVHRTAGNRSRNNGNPNLT